MTRGLARCRSTGDGESYQRALADLGLADRLAGRLASSELAGEVSLRRGSCALVRRDFPTAEVRFHEVLDSARRSGRRHLEARATGSLGVIRMKTGRIDDAADWFTRALELASGLRARVIEIKTLTNLGWCYYTLGDYDRALGFLSRAESMAAAGSHEAERLYALQNVGNTHYRLGDLDKAAAAYQRALSSAREVGDKLVMGELRSNLGIVALEQGRYDEAETSVREALRIKAEIEDLSGRQNSLQAEGEIWAGRGDYAKAEALYRDVLRSPHTERVALWETQADLARLCVKTNRPTQANVEFRKAFAIMEQSHGELRLAEHKISFFSSLARFYDSYVDFLVESGRSGPALSVADGSRARLLRETLGTERRLPSISPARAQEAARALDAVILSYWMAPRRSFLWVVTASKISIHPLPDEAEVRKQIEAHQTRIARSRDPLREEAPEAEWLYRNLVAPAEASMPKGSRVVFVPDGPLHQINPETLVVPSPERHYWIEDVVLTTAPSLALLAQSAPKRPRPAPSILIIGDALAASEEFPALPNAAREVRQVAEQFPASERKVYSGAQADPTAYTAAEPGRFTYIHFAAHAKANREVPLDSAVILSARNEVYKLYARDIVSVPLRADLVTLSACRSAGSRTYAGEGLVGLAWAFLSAGAGNVVAGLWNVEDASTSDLMEELYRSLRQDLSPAEALRAAKLRLLRSETAYRKPYYWAPFMIYTARRADLPRAVRRAGN